MKSGMLIIMLLAMSVVALTQSKQEPGTASSPNHMQTQIVELPHNPRTEPLLLFHLAMKDEKGMCKVHHHPLKVATIPVSYGLSPGINKESYSQAEGERFPNSVTQYEAGCTLMDAKEAKVLQCQKCLEAKKAWLADQLGVFEPPHGSRR